MIYYTGQDGNIRALGDDVLAHREHKYIKKIKSGNGWRYFYNMAEVNAFGKKQKVDPSVLRTVETGARETQINGKQAVKKVHRNPKYQANRFFNRINKQINKIRINASGSRHIINYGALKVERHARKTSEIARRKRSGENFLQRKLRKFR